MQKLLSTFPMAGMLTLLLIFLAAEFSVASGEGPTGRFGHQAVPDEQLNKEHEVTRKMADAADDTAARLREGKEVPKQRLVDMHDFFVNFVDACHHGKEEQYFFPVARVARPDLVPVIVTLEMHHDLGKGLLRGLDRALTIWEQDRKFARREAADNLTAYAAMLRRHIDLESGGLIEPAAAAFTPQQQEVVRAGFHYVESEQLGEGFHEKYHALAMDLLK